MFDKLEIKYTEALKLFRPKFGKIKHVRASEIIGKIVLIKRDKLTEKKKQELSSLMSNFLYYIK